jgi:hypothetical protein
LDLCETLHWLAGRPSIDELGGSEACRGGDTLVESEIVVLVGAALIAIAQIGKGLVELGTT